MYRFDMEKREWALLAGTPTEPNATFLEPRYCHEMVKYGEKLYVISGCDRNITLAIHTWVYTYITLEHIPAFNLVTNRWEPVDTRPWVDEKGSEHYPVPRHGQAFGSLGEYCYIMGGRIVREKEATIVLDDCWALHLPTLTWSRLPCSLPTPLCFHSAGITKKGNKLYNPMTLT